MLVHDLIMTLTQLTESYELDLTQCQDLNTAPTYIHHTLRMILKQKSQYICKLTISLKSNDLYLLEILRALKHMTHLTIHNLDAHALRYKYSKCETYATIRKVFKNKHLMSLTLIDCFFECIQSYYTRLIVNKLSKYFNTINFIKLRILGGDNIQAFFDGFKVTPKSQLQHLKIDTLICEDSAYHPSNIDLIGNQLSTFAINSKQLVTLKLNNITYNSESLDSTFCQLLQDIVESKQNMIQPKSLSNIVEPQSTIDKPQSTIDKSQSTIDKSQSNIVDSYPNDYFGMMIGYDLVSRSWSERQKRHDFCYSLQAVLTARFPLSE